MDTFTKTDDIIAIYKTAAKHKQFIADLEESFTGSDASYVSHPNWKPEINNRIYFKITNKKEKHRGYQYKDGFNADDNLFNPGGCCSGGGLYFTTLENLHLFGHFGVNIRPIVVPSSVPIYDEVCTDNGHWQCLKYHYKSKAPVVYLLPKIKLGSGESFRLLYNFELGNSDKNNQFAQSRMYLSDDPNHMRLYGGYYANKYIALPGNSYGTSYSVSKPIHPTPYVKKRKFHPEHKELVHCKVKDLILSGKCDELFALINKKKPLLYWLYYKPTNTFYENRVVSISELFYIFLKHQDKAFLHFMKDEYLPRFQKLPHVVKVQQKHEEHHTDINTSTQSIQKDIKRLIDENLYNIILNYGGIISGSFALKHYIGGDWQSDDIDVYLPELKTVEVEYNKYSKLRTKIYESVSGLEISFGNSKSYNMSNIVKIMDIQQINGTKLQFIFVKGDPFEFIKDNFDFDFCKVCYRPETETFDTGNCWGHCPLAATASAIAGQIEQAYMDKISKYNMDDYYSVYRAAKTMDRITKYIARGFTITNLDAFFDCLEKLFD